MRIARYESIWIVSNSSDSDVLLRSILVNWRGRIAIPDLGWRARGESKPIDVNHELIDLIPLGRIALATLSRCSPIRPPRLWQTLIGAIFRHYRPGTPKSEHLRIFKITSARYILI